MERDYNFSYAKINLFLKILGKRSDGYHNLESVISYIDLKDQIKFSALDNAAIDLKTSGQFANKINDGDNIFTKIFSYFQKEYGINGGIRIDLEKNIPVSAGLGGGSSNGAAFIKFLSRKFALNLSKNEQQAVAFKFGCDLPFFFEDKAKIIRSRGEEIEKYKNFQNQDILLVNPAFEVATGDIFNSINLPYSRQTISSELTKLTMIDLINRYPNDLQEITVNKFPIIGQLLNELKSLGAISAKMSGSGPTCFAIFKSDSDLQAAHQEVLVRFPGFFTKKASILSQINHD